MTRHDDVIKWKHFPSNWPFVRGIHRSPVNSPHKGQWRGALMFSSICAWINARVNNRGAGDLRRNHAHYDVSVMGTCSPRTIEHLWKSIIVPCQYPIRRLIARSRQALDPRNQVCKYTYRFESWQTARQQRCRDAWQMSVWWQNSN